MTPTQDQITAATALLAQARDHIDAAVRTLGIRAAHLMAQDKFATKDITPFADTGGWTPEGFRDCVCVTSRFTPDDITRALVRLERLVAEANAQKAKP